MTDSRFRRSSLSSGLRVRPEFGLALLVLSLNCGGGGNDGRTGDAGAGNGGRAGSGAAGQAAAPGKTGGVGGVAAVGGSGGTHPLGGATGTGTAGNAGAAGKIGGAGGSGTAGSSGGPPVALAAGRYHTCALLAGGTAECWGYESDSELGPGVLANTLLLAPVPVSRLTGATFIAAGDEGTCALLPGGTVSCWGSFGGSSPAIPVAIPA